MGVWQQVGISEEREKKTRRQEEMHSSMAVLWMRVSGSPFAVCGSSAGGAVCGSRGQVS